jgi:NADH-quinone oxidoreductase subunit L
VIHALSGEQDIRKMGGLAKKIPVTFWTFAIATAAIAGHSAARGLLLQGRDPVVRARERQGRLAVLFGVAALTALLTAFYMFRLLWLTFFGQSRMSPEVEHHVHESPFSMTGVLVVLARLSVVGGFLSIPHVLEPLLPLPARGRRHAPFPLRRGRRLDRDRRGRARRRRVVLRQGRGARRARAPRLPGS